MSVIGVVAGPVFVDGRDERFLRGSNHVPDDVAGGGWTDVVVVAPRQINGTDTVLKNKF